MSPNFQVVRREHEGGAPVLEVAGEVDLAVLEQFEEALAGIDCGQSDVAVIDMADVTFIDSTGLSGLVSALNRCREQGGDLRLVITHPNVEKVFQITDLHEVFTIAPTVDEALART